MVLMSRLPVLRLLVGVVGASLLLSGCAALGLGDSPSGRRVVAAFYPLAWVTGRIAGPEYDVVDLTTAGQEPHDLELGIQQTAAIVDAPLVVYEKGFQPSVDAAVDVNAQGAVLDAAAAVGLRPYAGPLAGDGPDPHFWQDPMRMADLGDAVARRLESLDPAHAQDYHDRAARLRRQLTTLDQAYAEGLRHCRIDTVVVSHDAFGYLSKYGLTVEPIAGLSPDAEPTPSVLAHLQQLIRDEGITTVFSEELVSPKTADTLAHDAGVRSRVLDPIEGLSDRTAGQDYLSLMRSNLAALEEADQC
jgi:zinc transport system substrate-binding protein